MERSKFSCVVGSGPETVMGRSCWYLGSPVSANLDLPRRSRTDWENPTPDLDIFVRLIIKILPYIHSLPSLSARPDFDETIRTNSGSASYRRSWLRQPTRWA